MSESKIDVSTAIHEANEAAQSAANDFIRNNPNFYDAQGFVWVEIKINADSGPGQEIQEFGFRKVDDHTLKFYCPLYTSSMGMKEIWAKAYSKKLQEYGIVAYMKSRID